MLSVSENRRGEQTDTTNTITMKNQILTLACCLLAMLTFSGYKPVEQLAVSYGTYGVCSAGQAELIALTINENNTFHYINNTDPAKKVDVSGKWERRGNAIVLVDYTAPTAIHSKWIIDKSDPCLRARLGMNWTRLCFLEKRK